MKRLKYLDTAKGILIICVVLGHYIQMLPATSPYASIPYFIKDFIYFFHIPAFIIISGITCNPDKWRQFGFISFFKSRFIRLIVPFLSFEMLGGATRIILFHISLKEAVYNTITLRCNLGSTWFLVTLFIAELLFYFCHNLGKTINLVLAVIAIFLFPICIPFQGNIRVVILRTLISLSFIIIGYHMKSVWLYENSLVTFMCFVILVLSVIFKQPMELWDVSITNPFLYTFRALLGCYAVLGISRILDSPFLLKCGINSIGIMVTHHLLKYFMEATGCVTSIWMLILFTALGAILVYALLIFINKYIPFIVGLKSENVAIFFHIK
jgi:fucose 4-O-acetylase-like acetyltransferase